MRRRYHAAESTLGPYLGPAAPLDGRAAVVGAFRFSRESVIRRRPRPRSEPQVGRRSLSCHADVPWLVLVRKNVIFSDMKSRRLPPSAPAAVLRRIKRHGPGFVFTPADFARLGSRAAIDQALSRLVRAGEIRRIGRGIYDYPKVSSRLGPLTPSAEAIAGAIARREGVRVHVSGARAANALGLSTQVPARVTFLTEGTPRVRKIAGQTVEFRRAVPKRMKGTGTTAGIAIEALRHLGRSGATPEAVRRLASKLTAKDQRELLALSASAPLWLRETVTKVLTSSSATSEGSHHHDPDGRSARG